MTENGSAGLTPGAGRDVTNEQPAQVTSPNPPSPVSAPGRAPDLSHRARAAAFDVAREARPWRENQSWWVVGIEGLLVLLVGVFASVQPDNAATIIRQLIALVLLIVSAGQIIEGFRFRMSAAAPWATLRGGVGVTVAALTLISPLSQFIQSEGSRQILGLGLLAYGILGVVGALTVSGERRYRWGALGGDVLAIVLGFLTFTREPGDTGNLRFISWVLIVGGVVLLILAFLIWKREPEAA
jgi:uncharacterized membrane protein HdeD (DUF308 family)